MVAIDMKVTISPIVARPCRCSHVPIEEDRRDRDGRGGARRDGGQGPPGQDRVLSLQELVDDRLQRPRLASIRVKDWITGTLPSASEACSARLEW